MVRRSRPRSRLSTETHHLIAIATPLDTPRLQLRTLELRDDRFILQLLNQASWLRFIGDRKVHSLIDAQRYIENGPQASYRQHGHGLLLVQQRDGTPIGLCGLLRREGLDDPDLGFALLDAYNGQGYAHEAAAAVLADGRSRLALTRVLAITAPDNLLSIRLLLKLGFAFERQLQVTPAAPLSNLYATILADDAPRNG